MDSPPLYASSQEGHIEVVKVRTPSTPSPMSTKQQLVDQLYSMLLLRKDTLKW